MQLIARTGARAAGAIRAESAITARGFWTVRRTNADGAGPTRTWYPRYGQRREKVKMLYRVWGPPGKSWGYYLRLFNCPTPRLQAGSGAASSIREEGLDLVVNLRGLFPEGVVPRTFDDHQWPVRPKLTKPVGHVALEGVAGAAIDQERRRGEILDITIGHLEVEQGLAPVCRGLGARAAVSICHNASTGAGAGAA